MLRSRCGISTERVRSENHSGTVDAWQFTTTPTTASFKMTLRTALRENNQGSHCFVMWTVERTVTVVRRQQVQTEVIVIGKELDVVWFAEIKYRARVAAIGSEKQMRDTLQDYLKGDWDFPWDRCDAEDGSRNVKRKLDGAEEGSCKKKAKTKGTDLSPPDGAEEGGSKKKAKTTKRPSKGETSKGNEKENSTEKSKQKGQKATKQKTKGGIILVSNHGGVKPAEITSSTSRSLEAAAVSKESSLQHSTTKPPSQNPSPQPPVTISPSSKPCSPSPTSLVAPAVPEGSALQNHSPRSPTNSTHNSPPLTSLVAPAVLAPNPQSLNSSPQRPVSHASPQRPVSHTSPQRPVSPNPPPPTSLVVPEGRSLNPSTHKPPLQNSPRCSTPKSHSHRPILVHSTPNNSHSPSPSLSVHSKQLFYEDFSHAPTFPVLGLAELRSTVESLRSELKSVFDAQAIIQRSQEELLNRMEQLENHVIEHSDGHMSRDSVFDKTFLGGASPNSYDCLSSYSTTSPCESRHSQYNRYSGLSDSNHDVYHSHHSKLTVSNCDTRHSRLPAMNHELCYDHDSRLSATNFDVHYNRNSRFSDSNLDTPLNCTFRLTDSHYDKSSRHSVSSNHHYMHRNRHLGLSDRSQSQLPHRQHSVPSCAKVLQRGNQALPSSAISKSKLFPPDDIAAANHKLVKPSKAATFAVKLAKKSFFGEDVMVQCTVLGHRDFPGLPVAELQELKQYIFSRLTGFWSNPTEFEPLWSDCIAAIGQACSSLRRKQGASLAKE